ncbi:MAG: hypothetical protein KJO79_05560 [Verrucomicrobiae bacterium]|nr:hypothetical protein [Verrucomicrobiae bacterium]NNJ86628.1 hypothetical protein [Akkermansiaceae bacterium]
MKTARIIRLIAVAFCLCLLPSCALLGSLLKIPASILQTAGRTVGLGLTDDAPQPYQDDAAIDKPESIKDAALERNKAAE